MIARVSADFETPELAELAIGKVRGKVGSIYSSGLMYNRRSDEAVKLAGGCIYTVIPTAVTTHNYITAVMESPASADLVPEPSRSRKAHIYVICDKSDVPAVRAVFNSLGGLSVTSPK